MKKTLNNERKNKLLTFKKKIDHNLNKSNNNVL